MKVESDRFTIERVIGSGATGTVFRARDRETGGLVAFKVMRSAGGHLARFEREAEVLARLEHPRIVRYVGHGMTAQGERFLAMEWLEGETARGFLGRAELTMARIVDFGLGLAEGLAATHRAGIVHRDIKPSNLILVDGILESVKLVDFGVAHLTEADHALTRTGDIVGTPAYMSPEQAAGVRAIGPQADVFGLGCVLHECLTGHPPLVELRPSGLGGAIRRAPGPEARLQPQVGGIPERLARLIERMLARSPSSRPSNGTVVALELEHIRAECDLSAVVRPNRFPAHSGSSPSVGTPPSGSSSSRLSVYDPASAAMSQTSSRTLEILGRHVPMPMAVLRSQCERFAKDPANLLPDDLGELVPALAEAVSRFVAPGHRSAVLEELRALIGA